MCTVLKYLILVCTVLKYLILVYTVLKYSPACISSCLSSFIRIVSHSYHLFFATIFSILISLIHSLYSCISNLLIYFHRFFPFFRLSSFVLSSHYISHFIPCTVSYPWMLSSLFHWPSPLIYYQLCFIPRRILSTTFYNFRILSSDNSIVRIALT